MGCWGILVIIGGITLATSSGNDNQCLGMILIFIGIGMLLYGGGSSSSRK